MSGPVSPMGTGINTRQHRYPYCIVWTPIPLITWMFPMIGHMGICMSNGIIRDFAGDFYVSEDNMAFGNPTRYIQLEPSKVKGVAWDDAVSEAAALYKTKRHKLCWDNCHSMVAEALNRMQYDGSTSWDMVNLCFFITFTGRYVGFIGVLKSLLGAVIMYSLLICLLIFAVDVTDNYNV